MKKFRFLDALVWMAGLTVGIRLATFSNISGVSGRKTFDVFSQRSRFQIPPAYVDGKHLLRFQREEAVLKFLQRIVDEA